MDPSPLRTNIFFYVYVLRSEKGGHFYIGFTNDLEKRLEEHNSGKSYWTSRYDDWQLIYYESYISKEDATMREKQLKRFAKGSAQLKRRLSNTLSSQR